ncbi:hypothetical protein [Paenibacillus sp. 1001270B_150601_E10]|uniref:hypothetical protein n=1 Tax=Paenibacillus sp. 1001270B_150601_E10 TaxID=2787079 RepID=UPI00189C6EFB|nr:hypothetical protein [Paenibacillus sp. 1001270B_150601_E10]
MSTALAGQIVIAEEVVFNSELKSHSIMNTRNRVTVSTYPAVAIVQVWMKLWMKVEQTYSVILNAYNPQGEALIQDRIEPITNWRPEGMPPGVDMQREIRLVITEPGVYPIVLRDSQLNVIAEYPLFVAKASE